MELELSGALFRVVEYNYVSPHNEVDRGRGCEYMVPLANIYLRTYRRITLLCGIKIM